MLTFKPLLFHWCLYQQLRISILEVKDISRKLSILGEKELIEARRAESSSLSHRMDSLRLISDLKDYHLCFKNGQ